jgi:tRNA(fMet)-specific endonuclease VapC
LTLKYLLDTNTVSYIIKGESHTARARLASLKDGEIACVSVITEGELQYGIAKSGRATVIRPLVEAFLSRIQVLPWERTEAQVYGALRAKLETRGKSLGNLDMMIAAHAISLGATLVTSDKALLRLAELPMTVNWAMDR